MLSAKGDSYTCADDANRLHGAIATNIADREGTLRVDGELIVFKAATSPLGGWPPLQGRPWERPES
jgi:hypothetical protein